MTFGKQRSDGPYEAKNLTGLVRWSWIHVIIITRMRLPLSKRSRNASLQPSVEALCVLSKSPPQAERTAAAESLGNFRDAWEADPSRR